MRINRSISQFCTIKQKLPSGPPRNPRKLFQIRLKGLPQSQQQLPRLPGELN